MKQEPTEVPREWYGRNPRPEGRGGRQTTGREVADDALVRLFRTIRQRFPHPADCGGGYCEGDCPLFPGELADGELAELHWQLNEAVSFFKSWLKALEREMDDRAIDD